MRVAGGDFSKWDGTDTFDKTLDWDLYNWAFAFVKVSEGKIIDPLFQKQWAAARGKVPRGAYHFFRCYVDPKQSVQSTIDFLGGDLGELPLVLDLETRDGYSAQFYVSQTKSWLAWYEELTGVRPLIYSRVDFLKNELLCANYPFFSAYKLWLAEYHWDKLPAAERDPILLDVLQDYPVTFPTPPAPFPRCSFWQYTAHGMPESTPGYYLGYGHKKQVDWNLYNGTNQQFLAEFNLTGVPDPDPEPPGNGVIMDENILFTLKVDATALNGRSSPEVINTNIIFPGGFKKNDIVKSKGYALDSNGVSKWYPIHQCTRSGVDVPLPAPVVWASDGGSYHYLIVTGQEVIPPTGGGSDPVSVKVDIDEQGGVVVNVNGQDYIKAP